MTDRFESIWDLITKTETCWLWKGHRNRYGYGVVKRHIDGRRVRWLAHRVIYELLVGPIPEGHDLGHACHDLDLSCTGGRTCPHRPCVKAIADEHGPAHLEPVTIRENLMRGNTLAAANARKTHCKRGHPFDLLNTRWTKNGARECRACTRLWAEQIRARRTKAGEPS